jgi:glutamate synthase (NADPH/NADH) small chain
MTQGPKESNGMRVAIIGSGPAGITIAIILARYGYQVTIFEGKDKIGGVLRYGIPEFRLPKSVLDDIEYRHLRMKGIQVRPNTLIGTSITIEDLFRDGYKSIFIGTGVWKPNSLHIKGETFGNVHFGINYLNNPDVYHLGERVIVIGAGNAAMDVARTALRHGARYITCFSITKKVAASDYEFSYAQLEGIDFEYNWKPVEIQDNGVIFRKVEEAEDGTFTDVPDSDTLFPSDSVVISISQGPQTELVNSTKGLSANTRGLLEADENGYTTRPGIFASGDAVNGARTVVEAVAHSKVVAESMHQYMQSLPKDASETPADTARKTAEIAAREHFE